MAQLDTVQEGALWLASLFIAAFIAIWLGRLQFVQRIAESALASTVMAPFVVGSITFGALRILPSAARTAGTASSAVADLTDVGSLLLVLVVTGIVIAMIALYVGLRHAQRRAAVTPEQIKALEAQLTGCRQSISSLHATLEEVSNSMVHLIQRVDGVAAASGVQREKSSRMAGKVERMEETLDTVLGALGGIEHKLAKRGYELNDNEEASED
jgi:hypothetical protein